MTDIATSLTEVDETAFIRGYTRAMLWSSNDDADGGPIDDHYDESHIPQEDLKEISLDCKNFIEINAAFLAQALDQSGYDSSRAGHDFWMTRQGHGTGYWDRDELTRDCENPDLGEALNQAAKAFGEHHDGPYVEDNHVHYGRSKATLEKETAQRIESETQARAAAQRSAEAALSVALGDAMDCLRVWSAWGTGTMQKEDFAPVAEDSVRVAEIAQAAVAAVNGLYESSRDEAITAINDALLDVLEGVWDCTAHPNAWANRTMQSSDFILTAENDEHMSTIIVAALDAITPHLANKVVADGADVSASETTIVTVSEASPPRQRRRPH